MPIDTTLDASAAALLGVIALEQIFPLVTVVRAANDEGYDADLRTLSLAWQLGQLMEPTERSGASITFQSQTAGEYSQTDFVGPEVA
jgi:hypothetical protein